MEIRRISPPKSGLRSELRSIDELMASIVERGLLEPIVIRPTEHGFEVVAGNRRLEACKRLRMDRILCHIVELDDREAYEASLIENLQHSTLDPIEEAEAFKRYVDDFGYGGISELARRIGKSPSYVSRRIALLRLPGDVREELLRRRKTPSIALELLSLDGDERKRVAELVIEKKVTTRSEVRSIVRHVKDSYNPHRNNAESVVEVLFPCYSREEQRQHSIGRALAKCIASLKVCMTRLDDVLEHLDDGEWVVREILMRHRRFVHGQVDELMNLKRRIMHHLPPASAKDAVH